MRFPVGFRMRLLTLALASGTFVGPAGSFAEACNVPVFRYALEHWQPDAYRAVLFHRGPLSSPGRERLATLQEGPRKVRSNLSIRTVDLDSPAQSGDRELLAALGNPGLPRLVVQYPAHLQLDQPVWSGPLDESGTSALLDSPLRQELLRRLTGGQTAVWLMVDCGDSGQDDTAAATLERELADLPRTLKLPELTDTPEDLIQGGPPLRVEFSLLRVRRDDLAEQPLVAMLLGSEADLATLNEPLAFPVFGRGRSLLPLAGAGISPENIRGSAKFLAGACSCQVKELNPGFDLLIAADWNALLPWAKSPDLATGGPSSSDSAAPVLVPIPVGSKSASAPRQVAETVPADDPPSSAPAGGFAPTLVILAGIALTGLILLVLRRPR